MSFLNNLGIIGTKAASIGAGTFGGVLAPAASLLDFTNAPTKAVTAATGGQGWNYTAPAGAQPTNTNTAQDTNPTGTTAVNGSVLGAQTTAPTGPTAAQIAANNQATSLANYNLGLLPQELQNALGNVQNQYNTNNNQLDSGHAQAQQGYNTSTNQNGQQFVTNKNQIASQASSGIHGLLAQLAAHGAGGSSAALFAAPDAVNKVAAEQRSGAGQTFGQNQQALDTNWGNYQSGFDNSKKQLADWLTQQTQQAQADNEGSRQTILQQLAGLQSNPTAAQPYIDQIKTSAQHVADLGNFNPTYNGVTPTYTAPDVASYTVNSPGAPVLGDQGNNTAASSPLQFLLGLKDKQQQPQF